MDAQTEGHKREGTGPRERPRTRLKASLLDRLSDDNPAAVEDEPVNPHERRRRWQASLVRDVESLLNARRVPEGLPTEFREAARSILQYGLPDLTGLSPLSVSDRTNILRAVEAALRLFEPRLTRVAVNLESGRKHEGSLRFSVNGLMRYDLEPEPIRFETVLSSNCQQFIVVRDRG